MSAALYFGSLIPLAAERNSPVLLPVVFGFAAALPVVAVAVLLTCGVRKVGILLAHLTALETHLRRATGLVLLAIGITLTIQNNFRRQRVISTLTASADTAPVVGNVQSAARPRR